MKTITATELKSILDQHQLWIETKGKQGQYANLHSANLHSAYLRDANLTGANLEGANLTGADLRGADLRGANLSGANLEDARLEGANLRYANLRYANLSDANLSGANLTGTILDKKKEQGTTMILSEEETAAILKMRADKVNKARKTKMVLFFPLRKRTWC
jgi:uncharacterized protein YjbI with pentapeptide repeats